MYRIWSSIIFLYFITLYAFSISSFIWLLTKFLLSSSPIHTPRKRVNSLFPSGKICVELLPYVMLVLSFVSELLITINFDFSLLTLIPLYSLKLFAVCRIISNSSFFLPIQVESSMYARSVMFMHWLL